MAISNAIENFHMTVNEGFLAKAQALIPKLVETEVRPVSAVNIIPQGQDFIAAAAERDFTSSRPMGRDDVLCLDFGDHQVGYVSFTLTPVGSPADAPAYLKLRLGEIPYEIAADTDQYSGEVSRSWIQEECLHVDVLPVRVSCIFPSLKKRKKRRNTVS